MQSILLLLARCLMAAIFALSGYNKATVDFASTAQRLKAKGFPMENLVTWATVGLELGCVVLLVLGLMTRLALVVLMAFTLAAGILFHDFWNVAAPGKYAQTATFFKNLAMVGGMIGLYFAGPGALSIDGTRRA